MSEYQSYQCDCKSKTIFTTQDKKQRCPSCLKPMTEENKVELVWCKGCKRILTQHEQICKCCGLEREKSK